MSLGCFLSLSRLALRVSLSVCETKKKSEILVLHAEPNREAVQGGWQKGGWVRRCAKLLPPKVKEIILAKRRRAKRFARNQHPYRLSDCLRVCVYAREWRGERERKQEERRGQVHPTNCQTESESEDEDEDEAELASNDRQDRMTFRGCCQLSLCCVFLFGFACVCSPHTHTHMRKKTLSTHRRRSRPKQESGLHSACPTQEASQ